MLEPQSRVNRRKFLVASAVTAVGGAAALAGCSATPAASTAAPGAVTNAQVIKWRCQNIEPSTSSFYKVHEQMMKDIDETSNGRLKIELFASGTLSPNESTFDAVSQGQFEMGISSPGYHNKVIPEVEAINLPLAFRNLTDLLMVYYDNDLKGFLTESYAKHNLHLLDMAACRGVVLNSTKPVESVEQLAQLKIRTHTTYALFVEKLGAKTVFIPGGEVYTALASGTADAATWGDESTIRDKKWYEVAKYLVYPMLLDAMLSYDTFVNQKSWDDLPKDLQAIVQKCSTEHLLMRTYLMNEHNRTPAIMEMEAAGLKRVSIKQEDLPKLTAAAEAVWQEVADRNERSKQAMKIISDYLRSQGYTDFKIS